MSDTYLIATIKPWNISNYHRFFGDKKQFHLISGKEHLTAEKIKRINPRYIFFPHWSWIIPETIWKHFECIVFHMTDLPFGRGGTPLQNLILRGITQTKISALRANHGIDTGDIYMKKSLDLLGSAEEIYNRMSGIIFSQMIPEIIAKQPIPKKQSGKVVAFKRRTPQESKTPLNLPYQKLYDFIRMLDAPEYPKAFLETEKIRFEFSRVKKGVKKLTAHVEMYEK